MISHTLDTRLQPSEHLRPDESGPMASPTRLAELRRPDKRSAIRHLSAGVAPRCRMTLALIRPTGVTGFATPYSSSHRVTTVTHPGRLAPARRNQGAQP